MRSHHLSSAGIGLAILIAGLAAILAPASPAAAQASRAYAQANGYECVGDFGPDRVQVYRPGETPDCPTGLRPGLPDLSGVGFVDPDLEIPGLQVTFNSSPGSLLEISSTAAFETLYEIGCGCAADGVQFPMVFVLGQTSRTQIVIFTANTYPTIAGLPDRVDFSEDAPARTLPFTIGDAETDPADLIVTSNDPFHASSFALGGSGANRTITYAPESNYWGSDSIRITVSDGDRFVSLLITVLIFSVNDPPVFDVSTIPDDIVDVEATGPGGAPVTFTVPTATDLVDPFSATPTVTCDPAPGDTFPVGTTTVVCTARDRPGDIATATFHVTVVDTTAPTVSVTGAAGVTLEATGPDGTTLVPDAFAGLTATDLVDGDLPVDCAVGGVPVTPETIFPLGSTPLACTATDAANNTSAAVPFAVSVVDRTAPNVFIPALNTIEATGPTGAPLPLSTLEAITATDLVDGDLPVTCSSRGRPVTAETIFPFLALNEIECTATDSASNVGQASQVFIVSDTTAPVLAPADDITNEATTGVGASVTYSPPMATDLVDGPLAPVCTPASGRTFAIGTTTVTCTATDTAGNHAERTFTVTVTDITAPVITVPAAITAEATLAAGASVPFVVSATDLVDGPVTPVCRVGLAPGTLSSPGAFPLGTTTVTCTATDRAANTATGSFTVTVADTTGPSITWVGGPQPTRSYTRGTLPGEPTCSATDVASTVTQCRVYGYSTAVGTHTLTARARDSVGNSSVSTRTYTVMVGGGGSASSPTVAPTPTQRPTATPTRPSVPTATPTQSSGPTAVPTRAPRPTATNVSAQPTAIPPTPTPPAVQPTHAPTRPPRG